MLLISEDNAKEDRNAIETFKECLKDEALLETLTQASTTYNCEQYFVCNYILGGAAIGHEIKARHIQMNLSSWLFGNVKTCMFL